MKKILVIYTGGTIGMVFDSKTNTSQPFNFRQIFSQVPEIQRLDYDIKVHSFHKLIDSSDMQPFHWIAIAKLIEADYKNFDGFVILHGSDTMAYTASTLSFMLENLSKPVIFTGSQLPIGEIRTDAKENLITAMQIAGSGKNGKTTVPEVCIYFDYYLYRGNRTSKYNSEKFEAFQSVNYPPLAEAGVHLKFNDQFILKSSNKKLKVNTKLETNIGILKIFPGMKKEWVEAALNTKGLKGLILETFGSGNAPTEKWLIRLLSGAIQKGIVILNVTQCGGGRVEQGRYETSRHLKEAGVIGGRDMTTEAALAKLMYLLPFNFSSSQLKKKIQHSLRGEITE